MYSISASLPVGILLAQKSPDLWTVQPTTTVFDAIKLMADKNIGSVLVLDEGNVVGIFTERDYTRKMVLMGRSSKETRVSEVLNSNVITVTAVDSIELCMKLMVEKKVRHLPIMDKGSVIGLVSIGDLVHCIISMQNNTIAQMEQYIAGLPG
jgi:CBS domain-containing protein